ncbi:stage II sporulation protein D [Ethanoligenens harbinense]|uniref:Stage II sporulation protein D n=1 Tax=Ethanoligenens harbinense (strain DSM 18485 / JCM 12961 / CGMCC 1.5033 / YUAN-3) TaxID=663278 RepID=E6U2X6_ETHHY|nr:stage II sporulation protein D [Ethanoligenens harbinense]ADU26343.1 stage II sporulation protein D [Ethanoligenens harbinense YUAN-3]AVQ95475.1 stage II sporulation protein D [Ethanoligenens harbinense YUAN-3]AYF38140.1 stage II sporulation protein D [Ethanoligenens harbinense]AYF40885.1 stage II sporulation protein D [Ethanoligenens harbinense]QCN91716.1 stage II sporulation protein D [Ethanoligenens harbinense]
MKDYILPIAAFTIFLLIIPLAALALNTNVQYNTAKNASSVTQAPPVQPVPVSAAETDGGFTVYHTRTKSAETLSADDYVRGVVAAEMPAEYPGEALKAQAAAAFTYAAVQRAYHRTHPAAAASIGGADVSDDPSHYQSYISEETARRRFGSDFDWQWAKITQAVQAVHGFALTQNGQLINALYFSCSAGKTESSHDIWGDDVPYLVEVSSTWDSAAPDYHSTVRVSQAAFQKAAASDVSGAAFGPDPSGWIGIVSHSDAGGVLTVRLGGKTVSGTNIQSLFGLHSTHFDVQFANGTFTFTVLGDGHGVGLSQYGACALAKQGKSWQDIVKYYYTGVAVTPFPW